ncbi:MAG: hypothetical protein ACRDZ7_20740 [Acidimicrobiia bacterium]
MMILPDLHAARQALEAAVRPAADVVASMSDPDIPIPRSEWNAGEGAAHLAMVALGYRSSPGGPSRRGRST